MKKVQINHPRLYITAIRNSDNQIEATYISNKYTSSNKLSEQKTLLDDVNQIGDDQEIIYSLNKIEYNRLDTYILRQKKVVERYRKLGKMEQLKVVSDSLDLLVNFRSKFDNWFHDTGYVI